MGKLIDAIRAIWDAKAAIPLTFGLSVVVLYVLYTATDDLPSQATASATVLGSFVFSLVAVRLYRGRRAAATTGPATAPASADPEKTKSQGATP
jgi:hypothetical protein